MLSEAIVWIGGISLPPELAIPLILGLLVIYVLLGIGWLGQQLEKRLSEPTVRWGVRVLGIVFALGGIYLLQSFLLVRDPYHPVYRGLMKFRLTDVILTALLCGGAAGCFAWKRWYIPGSLLAIVVGAAILVKPVVLPLMYVDKVGTPGTPYGLFSETHLFFVLSGLGLLVLGIGLFVNGWVKQKKDASYLAMVESRNAANREKWR